ncbi:hypothetical protein [Bdellovibrio bacteriovorus]|uniref:Uncharacterized protein n=1 Tax=Bdellovibrio bacteriovorus str. Tiberius TaxID=1069642 RepID=K7YT55_BDEBC|nr:hypothetical protein [Bdellovibrio bacteriovorus]AFY03086.1 Hypothetical protein Bdt_3411 [Bdellovibrio bacteriovorus str. Tiberius]
MKKTIFAIMTFLATAAFADPQFIELKSGKTQYVVGERAVLLASVRTSPSDPATEVHLEATWNTDAIKLTKFSDTEFAVVTPVLPDTSPYHWEVKAYLQNRASALNLNSSIALLQKENILLSQKHSLETDPEKKALLLQAISENEALILGLQTQLQQGRTLLETKELYVYPTQVKKGHRLSSPLQISTDKVDDVFVVGESGTVTFQVNPSEMTETYEFVSEVEATLGASPMVLVKNSDLNYQSSIDGSMLTVGSHAISASLFIRNKRDANSLLDAIDKAALMKAKNEQLRDAETNTALIAYYQREVDDLTAIISAFYAVYADMKIFVATANLTIEVVEISPVYIDQSNIYAYENSSGSYSVALTTEPTANVTIVASSPSSRVTFSTKNGRSAQMSLTFTPSNWSTPQQILFTTADNSIVDGTEAIKITHTASGGDYEGVRVPDVYVHVMNDDYGSILFDTSQADLSLDGTPTQYGVSLSAEPIGVVQVTIDTTILRVNGQNGLPVVLTFSPSDWNQVQYVSVEIPPGTDLYPYTYHYLDHLASSADGYDGVQGSMVFLIVP